MCVFEYVCVCVTLRSNLSIKTISSETNVDAGLAYMHASVCVCPD